MFEKAVTGAERMYDCLLDAHTRIWRRFVRDSPDILEIAVNVFHAWIVRQGAFELIDEILAAIC